MVWIRCIDPYRRSRLPMTIAYTQITIDIHRKFLNVPGTFYGQMWQPSIARIAVPRTFHGQMWLYGNTALQNRGSCNEGQIAPDPS